MSEWEIAGGAMSENIKNSQYVEEEDTIDLVELFFGWLKHIKFVIITTILTALCVAAVNVFLLVPVYQSTAELYILDASTSIPSLADIQIGNNLADDYVKIIKSRPVLDTVKESLGLEEDYKEISAKLSVVNDSNTHIISISVKDENASRAKMIADEIADVSKSFIAAKMGQKEPSVLHYGYADEEKVSPSRTKNTVIGALGGFVVSSAIVIALFIIKDNIASEDDVEKKLGLPVLGVLPYDLALDDEKVNNKKETKGGKK